MVKAEKLFANVVFPEEVALAKKFIGDLQPTNEVQSSYTRNSEVDSSTIAETINHEHRGPSLVRAIMGMKCYSEQLKAGEISPEGLRQAIHDELLQRQSSPNSPEK